MEHIMRRLALILLILFTFPIIIGARDTGGGCSCSKDKSEEEVSFEINPSENKKVETCSNLAALGSKDGALKSLTVIPAPKVVASSDGEVIIDSDWQIATGAAERNKTTANLLADDINAELLKGEGAPKIIDLGGAIEKKTIVIESGESAAIAKKYFNDLGIDFESNVGCKETRKGFGEAYLLAVDKDNESVVIWGDSEAGAYYATQTLWWLMRSSLANGTGGRIPAGIIADWPDYKYRGFFITNHLFPEQLAPLNRVKFNRVFTNILPGNFSYPPQVTASVNYMRHNFLNFIPGLDPAFLMPLPSNFDSVMENPEFLNGWLIEDEEMVVNPATKYAEGSPANKLLVNINFNEASPLFTDGHNSIVTTAKNNKQYYGLPQFNLNYNGAACASPPCIQLKYVETEKPSDLAPGCKNKKDDPDPNYKNQLNCKIYSYVRELDVGDEIKPGLYVLSADVKSEQDGKTPNDNCHFNIGTVIKNADKDTVSSYGAGVAEATAFGAYQRFSMPVYISEKDQADKVKFYIQPLQHLEEYKCTNAVFYIDNVKFARLGPELRNVILDDYSGITVTSADGKTVYKEGSGAGYDYHLVDDTKPLPNTYRKLFDPFSADARKVKILWNGSNPPQKIRVSYNMLMTSHYDDYVPNYIVPKPAVFAAFENLLVKPTKEYFGDVVSETMMTFDEIRSFNRDSRNWKVLGENGPIPNWKFFDKVRTEMASVTDKYFPDMPYLFEEMIDMYSNGATDCYLKDWFEWEDNCGPTGLGLAGMDRGRYIANPWAYGDDPFRNMRNAIALYKSLGMKYIPLTGLSKMNVQHWYDIIVGLSYEPLGFIGTAYDFKYPKFNSLPFDQKLEELKTLSNYFWTRPTKEQMEDPSFRKLELCNGIDDDGDGIIDEGFAVPDTNPDTVVFPSYGGDLKIDPYNCGQCGNICYKEVGRDGKCVSGACVYVDY